MLGRRLFLSLLALGALVAPARAADPAEPQHGDLYTALVEDAVFTAHARTYLFDETQTSGSDPAAWALGGWAGYDGD